MQPESSLSSLHRLVWTALCAALMAAGAYAQFPLWGVPFSMQPLFALLAGFLLGPRLGFLSMALYVAAGAAGLPVFAGGRSGLAHLLGPTGGYLLGFVLAAGITGRAGPAPLSWGRGLALGLVALVVVYGVGMLRLRAVLGFDWPKTLAVGFVPFIGFDLIKLAAAVAVRRHLQARGLMPS